VLCCVVLCCVVLCCVVLDALSEVRTSYGVFLNPDERLRVVEERIARWTRIPVENGEQFYFLRYQEGQQYKPHHDYFQEHLPGMERYLGKGLSCHSLWLHGSPPMRVVYNIGSELSSHCVVNV
jgi:hypothetical protein